MWLHRWEENVLQMKGIDILISERKGNGRKESGFPLAD